MESTLSKSSKKQLSLCFLVTAVSFALAENFKYIILIAFLGIIIIGYKVVAKIFKNSNTLNQIIPILTTLIYVLVFSYWQIDILKRITSSSELLTHCMQLLESIMVENPIISWEESFVYLYFLVPYILALIGIIIHTCLDHRKEENKRSTILQAVRSALYMYCGIFSLIDILQKLQIQVLQFNMFPEGLFVSLLSMYIAFDSAIHISLNSQKSSLSKHQKPTQKPQMKYAYSAICTPVSHGKYDVKIPDLPGCRTCGASLAEAVSMAEDAVAMWLCDAENKAETIPASSSFLAAQSSQFLVYIVVDTDEYRNKNAH